MNAECSHLLVGQSPLCLARVASTNRPGMYLYTRHILHCHLFPKYAPAGQYITSMVMAMGLIIMYSQAMVNFTKPIETHLNLETACAYL